MRKKFGLIAALIIGTTTSLQVSACTDDSKYQEFISDVNSGHAFFGILGAADNPLSKQIIDGLHTMQIKNNNVPSKWDNWLTEKKTEINSVTTNGTIDIKIYEKSPYANPSSHIVNQFWNDKKLVDNNKFIIDYLTIKFLIIVQHLLLIQVSRKFKILLIKKEHLKLYQLFLLLIKVN